MQTSRRIAVVTGAASGIGEAVARAYAEAGARGVVVADLKTSRDRLAAVAGGIDGLKVNFKAANIIYLTHPAAKELSLGCSAQGKTYSNELYAKGDRKPTPKFFDLVASAAAITFTLPKDDTTTGATRCLKRMGLLRGDKVSMRYKRLNMECTRTKTDAAITITRPKDE